MAVTVLERGPGILSNLGDFATLGGMLTGQPWLTALGSGMKATDSLLYGGGSSGGNSIDALGKLYEVISGWKNPASGNIAKIAKTASNAAKAVNPTTSYDELLRRGWGAW